MNAYPESMYLSGVSEDFAPRFFGDLTGIETKSSVPYIREFRFLFLAGIPLLFRANPLAEDFVGEPIICKQDTTNRENKGKMISYLINIKLNQDNNMWTTILPSIS